MRFYKGQHKNYCGLDLHARKMYVRILDQAGKTKVHKNIDTDPGTFFELVFPFLDNVAVAVECVFRWYCGHNSINAAPLGAIAEVPQPFASPEKLGYFSDRYKLKQKLIQPTQLAERLFNKTDQKR